MKTQKMYMFSVDYGLEEIDAIINDNKISLVYGEKIYEYYVDMEEIVHSSGKDISYLYFGSLMSSGADLPEVVWISINKDDIRLYIDNLFKKYIK